MNRWGILAKHRTYKKKELDEMLEMKIKTKYGNRWRMPSTVSLGELTYTEKEQWTQR